MFCYDFGNAMFVTYKTNSISFKAVINHLNEYYFSTNFIEQKF